MMVNYMLGGIPTPRKNMTVGWDDYSQYIENVPNHQPVDILTSFYLDGLFHM
jgi:hypothetical protein